MLTQLLTNENKDISILMITQIIGYSNNIFRMTFAADSTTSTVTTKPNRPPRHIGRTLKDKQEG
jgi:hypothetical protein